MRLVIVPLVLLIFIAGCSRGQETHAIMYAPAPQQVNGAEGPDTISQTDNISGTDVISEEVNDLRITSPAYKEGEAVPAEYTCRGANVNPEIVVSQLPSNAKSLALIFDDPDAPLGVWDHWILWNIPVTAKIDKNSVPSGAVVGKNSWGKNEYGGPCPPSGTHRYVFKVYALDSMLDLSANLGKKDLEKAMQGHILARAELMGRVSK